MWSFGSHIFLDLEPKTKQIQNPSSSKIDPYFRFIPTEKELIGIPWTAYRN